MPSARAFQSLGELESAVLNRLWEQGSATTAEVYAAVGEARGLAYTTILTVLQRLTRKGLVTREREGRTHRYSAAYSREDFARRRAETLASEVVSLGRVGLAAFLQEASRLDPGAVSMLRKEAEEQR